MVMTGEEEIQYGVVANYFGELCSEITGQSSKVPLVKNFQICHFHYQQMFVEIETTGKIKRHHLKVMRMILNSKWHRIMFR